MFVPQARMCLPSRLSSLISTPCPEGYGNNPNALLKTESRCFCHAPHSVFSPSACSQLPCQAFSSGCVSSVSSSAFPSACFWNSAVALSSLNTLFWLFAQSWGELINTSGFGYAYVFKAPAVSQQDCFISNLLPETLVWTSLGMQDVQCWTHHPTPPISPAEFSVSVKGINDIYQEQKSGRFVGHEDSRNSCHYHRRGSTVKD